jgi:hypothetical protein
MMRHGCGGLGLRCWRWGNRVWERGQKMRATEFGNEGNKCATEQSLGRRATSLEHEG